MVMGTLTMSDAHRVGTSLALQRAMQRAVLSASVNLRTQVLQHESQAGVPDSMGAALHMVVFDLLTYLPVACIPPSPSHLHAASSAVA
jgi:hypothetical protein